MLFRNICGVLDGAWLPFANCCNVDIQNAMYTMKDTRHQLK